MISMKDEKNPKWNDSSYAELEEGRFCLKNRIQDDSKPMKEYEDEDFTWTNCRCRCQTLKTFCNRSSLHGLQYVGEERSSVFLRIFWSVVFVAALTGAGYFITNLYCKWVETPVMVTIASKSQDIQNIKFPAVTICPTSQILTETFAKELLNDTAHRHFKLRRHMIDNFCREGNVQWPEIPDSIRDLQENYNFNHNTIFTCDLLMKEVKYPTGDGALQNVFKKYVHPKSVLVNGAHVECCTFNGVGSKKMYRKPEGYLPKGRNFGLPTEIEPLHPTGTGVNNGFKFEVHPKPFCGSEKLQFRVSVHSPFEEPNVEGDGLLIKSGTQVSYHVRPLVTEAQDSLHAMRTEVRECAFSDEQYLKFYNNYTHWNCMTDCLANDTYIKCKCLPPYLAETDGMEVCTEGNGKGYGCFINVYRNFTASNNCKCLHPCNDVTYLVSAQYIPMKNDSTSLFLMDVYFTESTYFPFYRSKLYELSDFLASIGGILGLFLGFSFISMIEIVYFSTLGFSRIFTKKCK